MCCRSTPATVEESSAQVEPKSTQDEGTQARFELKRLRKKALKNAKRLALTQQLDHLVQPTGNSIFGYLVNDFPPPDASKLSLAVWATLIACCEQTNATKSVLSSLLPPDSRLRSALNADRVRVLIDQNAAYRISECGECLISLLDESAWLPFMNLVSTYRSIRLMLNQLDLEPWKDL